jgi:hypothetical protein
MKSAGIRRTPNASRGLFSSRLFGRFVRAGNSPGGSLGGVFGQAEFEKQKDVEDDYSHDNPEEQPAAGFGFVRIAGIHQLLLQA